MTRARMTQIMQLLHLHPGHPGADPVSAALRPLASRIDWAEQRRLFEKIMSRRALVRARPPSREDATQPPRTASKLVLLNPVPATVEETAPPANGPSREIRQPNP